MLATYPTRRTCDTMTTRTTVIVTIGLLAALMVALAVAALFAGDISERAAGIVTSVLGALATVLAGLLLFLRLETVSGKVDDVASKAETAAKKIEQVHEDVLNGPMRENVKRAIGEAERDPVIREQRIENVAKGVSRDRHAKRNRDTTAQGWAQLEARRLREQQQEEDQQS